MDKQLGDDKSYSRIWRTYWFNRESKCIILEFFLNFHKHFLPRSRGQSAVVMSNTLIHNISSLPQITRFSLGNPITLTKRIPFSSSKKQKR